MSARNDTDHLAQLRARIEARLDWGDASGWQNRDFERLSELIFEETHVSLSASTLKRLWGRVKYDSLPTATTLDALARFAGFPTWRDFQRVGSAPPSVGSTPSATPTTAPAPPKAVQPVWRWAGVAAFGLALLLTGIWAFQKRGKSLRYGAVAFSSQPVARGIPNTVQFRYDATDSNADSMFIQQSWNPQLRFRVKKTAHQYASTYYFPGYFRAKLVLNDSVVREHDLYLRSEGWLGTLDRNPIPAYFRNLSRPGGAVGLTDADLAAQQVDFTNEIPYTSLYYVEDLGELPGDEFTFETRLRSTFNRGDAVCQRAYVGFLCSNGYHFVPLSIPGCVGELALGFGDAFAEGKTSDLSGFGVDFTDWVTLRCEVRQKAVRVLVNDRLAWQGRFTNDVGKLVGLRYRFHGTGEVATAVVSRADGTGGKKLL